MVSGNAHHLTAHHFVSPITILLAMAAKKSFVLRMDEATFAALEKWAADEFRSVNGQIEWLLSRALKEAGRERAARPVSVEQHDPQIAANGSPPTQLG